MGWIRAMGSTVASRGFVNPAPGKERMAAEFLMSFASRGLCFWFSVF